MFRLFYTALLFLLPLQGFSSSLHTVNLTIYKNSKTLNKALDKLPPALRKTISIEKKGKRYKAQTLLTSNKKILIKLLPEYQKVFPHAFIATVSLKKTMPLKDKKSNFFKSVQNKTLYLCPEKNTQEALKFLIEVSFTDTTVTYYPLRGKMPPVSALYKVKENKLFLYQKDLFNPKVYSKLEKKHSKYLLLSSWAGKKKVKHLRYYFNIDDAKAYLEQR